MITPHGIEMTTHPHSTTMGLTKGMFQLVCPFQHIQHHRVHERHVPAGVSFAIHPHTTGFTKDVFQLVCPFQHIHTSQVSPKACPSWCVLFNTSTHNSLHTKGVFQLVCPFQDIHILQGLPRRFPAGVSFSTHPHITGFIKKVFQLMCLFQHIHTQQGSLKACSSCCVLFNTSTHHRVHQRCVPAGVSFSTHPHITGFTKGVFQLVCPFQHIHTS